MRGDDGMPKRAGSDTLVSLAGTWSFQLDPHDRGEKEAWFRRGLDDRIMLPGTTDQAGKGYPLDRQTMRYSVPFMMTDWPGVSKITRLDRAGFLLRPWYYVGKAWYQRRITIPENWSRKHVLLKLERVIWRTDVWIDTRYVGSFDSLATEHGFDLGRLAPGDHRLTIRVDNGMIHNIGLAGHSYGPETQSRWNGLVGRLELNAVDPILVRDVQVYPDPDRQHVRVTAKAVNLTDKSVRATLSLTVQAEEEETIFGSVKATAALAPGETPLERTITVGKPVVAWDEFNTTRYRLVARLTANGMDSRVAPRFGFRSIRSDGRKILINGRRVFLRGTLDCCVYPRTGHPPTSLAEWLRVMRVIKEYGFNHVRYHSWCPPEEAFEAADRLGLYLAPETPFWVDTWITTTATHPKLLGEDADVLAYIRNEMRRIADRYGNHPSFAFFCIGNEFGMNGDWSVVNRLVTEAKQHDPRRLYSGSTTRRRVAADDYWVTAYAGGKSARGPGPARTDWDFSATAALVNIPLIAHETGQRPVFPDYEDLLPKFTGPLKPYNLIRLRDALAARGLLDQIKDFERASAEFQYVLYKAEHEAFLRTPDYAGFQLLMLNDFTGQSEALVGIVDPFWQSKGVITPKRVRQWCGSTVLLARFERYVWTNDQTLKADIEARHTGPKDLDNATVSWVVELNGGDVVAHGAFTKRRIRTGPLSPLGQIEVPLDKITRPSAMRLRVSLGDVTNEWKMWVYPSRAPQSTNADGPEGIVTSRRFDAATRQALAHGDRVLLQVPHTLNRFTRRAQFTPVYWSAGWSLSRIATLGILCDPKHPALAAFPNDGHSDWQWQALIQGGTMFIMDDAPAGFRPIIQPVTDFHQNHLLGQLFETRVGPGRLLVCGYDLDSDLEHRPAARQLRRSLTQYMQSNQFRPQFELPIALLSRWLTSRNTLRNLGATIRADGAQRGYGAEQAIDGSVDTLWHTPWTPNAPPHPHWLEVDMCTSRALRGITYLPRQDQSNGRVGRYEVYVSDDPKSWGKPIAAGQWKNSTLPQTVTFTTSVHGRYLKLAALTEVAGQPFASVAELDVILDHAERGAAR